MESKKVPAKDEASALTGFFAPIHPPWPPSIVNISAHWQATVGDGHVARINPYCRCFMVGVQIEPRILCDYRMRKSFEVDDEKENNGKEELRQTPYPDCR